MPKKVDMGCIMATQIPVADLPTTSVSMETLVAAAQLVLDYNMLCMAVD
jgi:hypothetical protein